MKAFYLSNSIALTDELRKKLRGHRVENADRFSGVASRITEAEVIGNHPHIVKALKAAGVRMVGAKAKPKKKEPDEPIFEPEVASEPETVLPDYAPEEGDGAE